MGKTDAAHLRGLERAGAAATAACCLKISDCTRICYWIMTTPKTILRRTMRLLGICL